jgi:hypothetical protein
VSGTAFDSLLDHLVGESVLAVEFECSSLHDHGARMLPRSPALRDKPERKAAAHKAESQVPAGRTGPDDQNGRMFPASASKRLQVY